MEREEIKNRIEGLTGNIGFYYENLVTGEVISYDGHEAYRAASVIKLPIFMYVMKLVSEGKLSLTEELIVHDEDKCRGCGALKSFDGNVKITMEGLCNLMITISDNTATNMVIERVGLEILKAGFRDMGLEQAVIARKLCDMEAASKGLQNYVCPAEIGMLLKQVYDRTFASAAISERIERTLLEQQVRHKIPGYIGMDKKIANKTGEEDGTTNDAAIVFAKKPFILVICANKTDVPETERFIRQVALDLYKENGGDWDAK